MGENELIEDIVVDQAIRIRDSGESRLIDVAIRSAPKSAEDREQRNRVAESRKLNQRKTAVATKRSLHLVKRRGNHCRGWKHKEVRKRPASSVFGHRLETHVGLRDLLEFEILVLLFFLAQKLDRLILFDQRLLGSLGGLALPSAHIGQVVPEKLLGDKHALGTANDEIAPEFILALAGGIHVHLREMTEIAPEHQRNLTEDLIGKGLELRLPISKLVLDINVSPNRQRIGPVLKTTGMGEQRAPIGFRGRFIAKVRSVFSSKEHPDESPNVPPKDRTISEFQRERIRDTQKRGDVNIEKCVEGIDVVLNQWEVCGVKIGLKHMAWHLHSHCL